MSYRGYKNKESYDLSRKKYNERHKPQLQEYQSRWYQEHREVRLLAAKTRYEANRVPINNRAIRYRQKVKTEVITYYGNGKMVCVKCGFDDLRALTIDHINGGGGAHMRELGITAGTKMYSWLRRNEYPKGYQTLCSNCQRIKQEEQHKYYNYLAERNQVFEG